jgi:hypothetical protein
MKEKNENGEIMLSQKERILEFVAQAMCFMLLLGCFLKVMFF